MTDRLKSTPTDPDPPPVPAGPGAEEVALRYTFRTLVAPEDAAALDQIAGRLAQAFCEIDDCGPSFAAAIGAAADDLLALAAYLDWFSDDRGDRPERHEIPVAAAVLEAAPVVAAVGAKLRAAVGAVRSRE